MHDPNISTTNSTSMARPFGSIKDFVRGHASQFPFAPGGLDAATSAMDADDEQSGGLRLDLDFLKEEGRLWLKRRGLVNQLPIHYYRYGSCCARTGSRSSL